VVSLAFLKYRSLKEPTLKEITRPGFDKKADAEARRNKKTWNALAKYLERDDMDVSDEVDKDEGLKELLARSDYIVGKVIDSRDDLPEMSLAELAWCTGEEEKEWYNEAWVAVGEWIYDVTGELRVPTSVIIRRS
jgi:hypothetical protein